MLILRRQKDEEYNYVGLVSYYFCSESETREPTGIIFRLQYIECNVLTFLDMKMTKLQDFVRFFIDHGGLQEDLKKHKDPLFPHIKFVSLEESSMRLRVLLAGLCPHCGRSLCIKNICTISYAERVLEPVLQAHFPSLKMVAPVLSTDEDFVMVVTQVGGKVCYPFATNIPMDREDLCNFLYNLHPDIDATTKFTMKIESKSKFPGMNDKVSAEEFLDFYRVNWLIDDTAAVVVDGKLIRGKSNIVPMGEKGVPKGTRLKRTQHGQYFLEQVDKALFKSNRYSAITFNA